LGASSSLYVVRGRLRNTQYAVRNTWWGEHPVHNINRLGIHP